MAPDRSDKHKARVPSQYDHERPKSRGSTKRSSVVIDRQGRGYRVTSQRGRRRENDRHSPTERNFKGRSNTPRSLQDPPGNWDEDRMNSVRSRSPSCESVSSTRADNGCTCPSPSRQINTLVLDIPPRVVRYDEPWLLLDEPTWRRGRACCLSSLRPPPAIVREKVPLFECLPSSGRTAPLDAYADEPKLKRNRTGRASAAPPCPRAVSCKVVPSNAKFRRSSSLQEPSDPSC